MSCMYFSLNQRLQDDSTESSESITYWRKSLVANGLPRFSVVALTDREMDPLADLAMRQSPCDHASAGDLGKAICGISRSRTLRRFRTPALRR